MRLYFRILGFVKPYWKRIALSIICTILYSIFNGLSIYLFIPLLDMLFNVKQNGTSALPSGSTFHIPTGLLGMFDGIKVGFIDFIFKGSSMDALLKICLVILT